MKKNFNHCFFGKRLFNKSYEDTPGPGQYSLPTFIDANSKRYIGFHPRIDKLSWNKYPAPNAYKPKYSQTEIMKSMSFGKDKKLKYNNAKTLGPGAYSIKSTFDRIVELYSKKNQQVKLRRSNSKNCISKVKEILIL